MAAGDEAAAAGLHVVPATADIRQGYAAINTRGDELARHQTSGTHPFTRITGQATTAQIRDGAVTAAKLADGSVTNAAIGLEAVSGSRIAPGAISNPKILDRAVSRDKLAKRYTCGTVVVYAAPLGTPINSVTIPHGLSGTPIVVLTPRAEYVYPHVSYSGSTVSAWARADDPGNVTLNWIAMEV